MNYKIIHDEVQLRSFIDWLPELNHDEKYYLCLFARSKYTKNEDGVNGLPHIKSDKAQLKRFVSDKERMFSKIKQLECEVGAYTQRELIVPQEALALYITVNPRNMFKATINTMCKLANSIRDQNVMMNPHQEALSEIQRTKSRTCYVDFDYDIPLGEGGLPQHSVSVVWMFINKHVNPSAVTLLRSRGGFHIMVDPNKVQKEYVKTFYQGLSFHPCVDQAGDQMIPVPGCTQGNFTPYFIS